MKFSRPHSMMSGHRPVDTVMHAALGFWSMQQSCHNAQHVIGREH